MNILKVKRIFYLFITLAVIGVLVTSCEREIVIEDDLDGIKQVQEDILLHKKIDPSIFNELEGNSFFVSPDGKIHTDENANLLYREEANSSDLNISKKMCCNIDPVGWINNPNTFKVEFTKTHSQYLYIYHFKRKGNIHLGTSVVSVPVGCSTTLTYTNPLPFIPDGTNVKSDLFLYDGSYCDRQNFYWRKP